MRVHRLALAVLPLVLAACATTAVPPKATPKVADHHRKPVDATPAEGIAPTPRRVSRSATATACRCSRAG